MDSDIFYDKYIADDFETKYVPKIFETVCKQYLIRKNRKGLMDEIFEKIGKYYYDDPVEKKNGEFDIVTQDDLGYIFYESKFRKDPITENMIQNEIRQVNQLCPDRMSLCHLIKGNCGNFPVSMIDISISANPFGSRI